MLCAQKQSDDTVASHEAASRFAASGVALPAPGRTALHSNTEIGMIRCDDKAGTLQAPRKLPKPQAAELRGRH